MKTEELSTFENQVGGHKGYEAMLLDPTGKHILKPFNQVEFEFYEAIKDQTRIGVFFPKYFGTKMFEDEKTKIVTKYIQIENLTFGFEQPCVCDLKIGFRGLV